MASQSGYRAVKPIFSTDKKEVKRRVLSLYRAWFRQIPFTVKEYELRIDQKLLQDRLRHEFLKNKHLTDIRAIDKLILKGQLELKEVTNVWKQNNHITKLLAFEDDAKNTNKSTSFLAKFYGGTE